MTLHLDQGLGPWWSVRAVPFDGRAAPGDQARVLRRVELEVRREDAEPSPVWLTPGAPG